MANEHEAIDGFLDQAGYWLWAGNHLTFCNRMGCRLCALITSLEALRSHFQNRPEYRPNPEFFGS